MAHKILNLSINAMYSKLCSTKKKQITKYYHVGVCIQKWGAFSIQRRYLYIKVPPITDQIKTKNFYHAMPPKTNRRKGGHPKKPIASISPNQEPMLQRPLRVPGVLCRLTSPSVVPEHGVSPTNCPPRKMIRTSRRGTVASEGQELTSSDKTRVNATVARHFWTSKNAECYTFMDIENFDHRRMICQECLKYHDAKKTKGKLRKKNHDRLSMWPAM